MNAILVVAFLATVISAATAQTAGVTNLANAIVGLTDLTLDAAEQCVQAILDLDIAGRLAGLLISLGLTNSTLGTLLQLIVGLLNGVLQIVNGLIQDLHGNLISTLDGLVNSLLGPLVNPLLGSLTNLLGGLTGGLLGGGLLG